MFSKEFNLPLFIALQGPPGSCKSTFIRKHGLSPWTISSDQLRLMFGGMEMSDNALITPFSDDRKVWAMLHELLEKRMKSYSMVILDATHTNHRSLGKYVSLCERYGYQMVVLRMDTTLEDCQRYNLMRDQWAQVPAEVIDRKWEEFAAFPSIHGVEVVNSSVFDKVSFWEYFAKKPLTIDTSKFDRVDFIGDIQGCNTTLERYLRYDEIMQKRQGSYSKAFRIFTGDLTDRGAENFEVLRTCLGLDQRNTRWILGNHDQYSRDYFNGVDHSGTIKFFSDTGDQYRLANPDKKLQARLKKFYHQSFETHLEVRFGEKKLFVCHGGVNRYYDQKEQLMVKGIEFVRGFGRYDQAEQSDKDWDANNTDPNLSQVRGHRNPNFTDFWNGSTACLEGKVEFNTRNHRGNEEKFQAQGRLRVLRLTANGFQNLVFR
ncbi:MAG: AAA family ATPase [Patescibacteria group bacterium]